MKTWNHDEPIAHGSAADDVTPTATIAVINAGLGDPSSTRLLTDRIAQKALDSLAVAGIRGTVAMIDLGPIAVQVAQSLVSGLPGEEVQAAIERLAAADAIIVGTPVYKAGISGLFKSFIDLIDNDLLIAMPVILAATGGTARHAMVVDEQLRPLFAFLRALPAPTSIYAAPEDWSSPELGKRISRAATELALLVKGNARHAIAIDNWGSYQHEFAGDATRAEQLEHDLDFDTELMRLAAGGTLRQPPGTSLLSRDEDHGNSVV